MSGIDLWVDGGASPNPGYGVFAALLKTDKHERLVSGTEDKSTNNRAELRAALLGFQAIHDRRLFTGEIRVYSDSRYLVETACGNWRIGVNGDLWQELLELLALHGVGTELPWTKIEWIWVKGHSGNRNNERCHNEVTRLINIHNAKDLINIGERMSDDQWLDHTQKMIDFEKRKVGLTP